MNICFEFLQVALGTREGLSQSLKDEEWQQCYVFCKRQALLGIGFSAMEKLHDAGVPCPTYLRIKWLGYALQTEKLNKKLNCQCQELTAQLEHDGLHCCILKGQSHQLVYPESLRTRRTSGDIDVWCCTSDNGLSLASDSSNDYDIYYGHKAIRKYVRQQFRLADIDKMPKACYHHIDALDADGTHVEVHYRPSFLHSPIRNHRLQRFFILHADECMKNKTSLGFSMLTQSVNVVYQMCHLFSHYLEMGLGLRQLMDYYFTLMQWHKQVLSVESGVLSAQSQRMWVEGLGMPVMSKEEVMSVLRSFGMDKFAAAVMWVLHEVFAMSAHYYICEPNEKEGCKLLAEIMQGGNFGQYDERGKNMRNGGTIPHAIWKLKRVMRLVSSYPEEALCEPLFRVYHFIWRIFH